MFVVIIVNSSTYVIKFILTINLFIRSLAFISLRLYNESSSLLLWCLSVELELFTRLFNSVGWIQYSFFLNYSNYSSNFEKLRDLYCTFGLSYWYGTVPYHTSKSVLKKVPIIRRKFLNLLFFFHVFRMESSEIFFSWNLTSHTNNLQ